MKDKFLTYMYVFVFGFTPTIVLPISAIMGHVSFAEVTFFGILLLATVPFILMLLSDHKTEPTRSWWLK